MKVTITDPKQQKPHLTVRDLSPGTLFEMYTKRSGHYIGLIVRSTTVNGNNLIRLNGNPSYSLPVLDSWYLDEEVNIINSVELSTK